MYTLLIWQNLVDQDHLLLIPNDKIDNEFRLNLESAAGKFINSDDDIDDVVFIQNKFFDYDLVDSQTYGTGLYTDCIIEEFKINANITNVYIMGEAG